MVAAEGKENFRIFMLLVCWKMHFLKQFSITQAFLNEYPQTESYLPVLINFPVSLVNVLAYAT